MPHLLWKGPGDLQEAGLDRATKPKITEPSSPNDSPDETKLQKFFYCTVQDCNKKFTKAMLVARHFNSTHSDLREDKDSWREFSLEAFEEI